MIILKADFRQVYSNGDQQSDEQADCSEQILFEMDPVGFQRTEDGRIVHEIDKLVVLVCPRLAMRERRVESHGFRSE